MEFLTQWNVVKGRLLEEFFFYTLPYLFGDLKLANDVEM